jgi:hypothetical protein
MPNGTSARRPDEVTGSSRRYFADITASCSRSNQPFGAARRSRIDSSSMNISRRGRCAHCSGLRTAPGNR